MFGGGSLNVSDPSFSKWHVSIIVWKLCQVLRSYYTLTDDSPTILAKLPSAAKSCGKKYADI